MLSFTNSANGFFRNTNASSKKVILPCSSRGLKRIWRNEFSGNITEQRCSGDSPDSDQAFCSEAHAPIPPYIPHARSMCRLVAWRPWEDAIAMYARSRDFGTCNLRSFFVLCSHIRLCKLEGSATFSRYGVILLRKQGSVGSHLTANCHRCGCT